MKNVSQGPAHLFVKSIQKYLPKQTVTQTLKSTVRDEEKITFQTHMLKSSHVKILTHEEPQDTSYTREELKGTDSGTTSMQESATAS